MLELRYINGPRYGILMDQHGRMLADLTPAMRWLEEDEADAMWQALVAGYEMMTAEAFTVGEVR